MIELIKNSLPPLTVVANVIFVLILGLWIAEKAMKKEFKVMNYVRKHLLVFSVLVALTATGGSLFYSEVLGYNPCKLCWLQRIFMYPQAIILPMAHMLGDKKIFRYTVVLSVFGIVLAIYHYLLQVGVLVSTNCSVVGFSLSCSETFFKHYGYITIPFMSISAFALLILFGGMSLSYKNSK